MSGAMSESESSELGDAVRLLHEATALVRTTQDLEPTLYALLCGVTASRGLGMHRAAIFRLTSGKDASLVGRAAVGSLSPRAPKPTNTTLPTMAELYESGLIESQRQSPLDKALRQMAFDARGHTLLALAVRRGRVVAASDEGGLETTDGLGPFDPKTLVVAPLRGRSRVRGALVADCPQRQSPIGEEMRCVFDLLADQIAQLVENAEEVRRIARDTHSDRLTGLGGRESFETRIKGLVAGAVNDGPTVGLLVLDLDNFVEVVEGYGPEVGDQVLSEVGRRLGATLRPGEGYRTDSKRFAVLLSGVDMDGLAGASKRILAAVTRTPFAVPRGPTLSLICSMGGALLPGRAEDVDSLVASAERETRRAKREGRNRIKLA